MSRNIYEYNFSMKRDLHRKIFAITGMIILLILVITLILDFILFPVKVASDSMEPDVQKDSVLLVCPLVRNPDRGDVILLESLDKNETGFFPHVLNNLSAFFTFQKVVPSQQGKRVSSTDTVRRVVGLPGDTIYMNNYVLYAKPAGSSQFLTEFELTKHPYNVDISGIPADWQGSLGTSASFDQMVLGKNEYFVLGDQRVSAVDSRLWGVVSHTRIKGKAFMCYFPFKRIRLYH